MRDRLYFKEVDEYFLLENLCILLVPIYRFFSIVYLLYFDHNSVNLCSQRLRFLSLFAFHVSMRYLLYNLFYSSKMPLSLVQKMNMRNLHLLSSVL